MVVFFLIAPSEVFSQSSIPVVAPWTEKQRRFVDAYRPDSEHEAHDTAFENKKNSTDIQQERSLQASRVNADSIRTTPHKLSRIEEAYAARILDPLEQFGYDLFGIPDRETQEHLDSLALSSKSLPSGAVQDNFILGMGDEIEITFTGQRSDRETYTINAQGLILIKDFPPIPAAGRTMGQVRISLQSAARNLHNTDVFISLASVRQIGVLVAGHVQSPGRQTMTVFHTVLDALLAAGGIQKTGSLRQIKLVRGGSTQNIDLYSLLLGTPQSIDFTLQDGDRIIVPAIGATLAVSGSVKRPGIYEIRPGLQTVAGQTIHSHEKLSLADMILLGGGPVLPGNNRYMKMEITNTGEDQISEVKDLRIASFGNGSILVVSRGKDKKTDTVELQGHTRRPGIYDLLQTPNLSELITDNKILGPDIYPLIGILKRWDPDLLTYTFKSFPPRLVLKRTFDMALQDGDTVHLFSNTQIRQLRENSHHKNERLSQNPEIQNVSFSHDAPPLDPAIQSFLTERLAFVRGAVRDPGAYPVTEHTTLDMLTAVSGGFTLDADRNNIEIIAEDVLPDQKIESSKRQRFDLDIHPAAEIIIAPGDSVRVNRKQKKIQNDTVLVMGEIKNPGHYDLMPGDKLSDLIARTGGLTPQSYAPGAIFSRESIRRSEELRFKAQAREMKIAIARALENDDQKIGEGKITEARALASELEKAEGVGRITVEADPTMLKLHPELDILLEPGDRIYIPKRSLTVRVNGEVLSPAHLQFRKDKDPRAYIEEAGGFTHFADKDRTFVLYPDGSAQPLKVSAWNHKSSQIPPGSTIVVPRDPEPFDFIQSAKDISQILSNLAIIAIFIDDVRDDN